MNMLELNCYSSIYSTAISCPGLNALQPRCGRIHHRREVLLVLRRYTNRCRHRYSYWCSFGSGTSPTAVSSTKLQFTNRDPITTSEFTSDTTPMLQSGHNQLQGRQCENNWGYETDLMWQPNDMQTIRTAAQYWVRPRATFSHPGCKHFLPPPCLTQNFVEDWADLSQPSTEHRRPPPWAVHSCDPPTADLLQPSNLHRLPPPWLQRAINKTKR